jgi:hypothetical protein
MWIHHPVRISRSSLLSATRDSPFRSRHHSGGKQISELGACSCQAGHSRSQRAFQNGGNLLIGEFFILAQYDDPAELYGKPLDRGADQLLLEIAHKGRIGICRSIHSFGRIIPVQIELGDLRRRPPSP